MVLDRFSRCVASVYTNTYEVGAGQADRAVVLNAWSIHRQLCTSATTLRRRATLYALLAALLTFLASTAAILSSYLDLLVAEDGSASTGVVAGVDVNGQGMDVLDYLVVILPALVTLTSAYVSFGGFTTKWGALLVASHAIAAEIYCFRMSVGAYSLTRTSQEDNAACFEHVHEDGRGQDNTNLSVHMHASRMQFSANIQKIVIQVCTEHLSTDALTFNTNDVLFGQAALAKHVDQHVFAGNRTAAGGSGTDDNLRPLSNAEYFEHRVKPLLRSVSLSAPLLKSAYRSLQALVFLASALATVLGAVGQQTWIPVAISLSTFFTTLIVESNVKEWLAGTQRAVGELQALVVVWNGVLIPLLCHCVRHGYGVAPASVTVHAQCSSARSMHPRD